jgi:hypothetical protein
MPVRSLSRVLGLIRLERFLALAPLNHVICAGRKFYVVHDAKADRPFESQE